MIKTRGQQHSDSTYVMAACHVLSRLELISKTVCHALNALAIAAPTWVKERAPVSWFKRYMHRYEEYRLPHGETERAMLAKMIGADELQLLTLIYALEAPTWLREIPIAENLRRVWVQQFQGQN